MFTQKSISLPTLLLKTVLIDIYVGFERFFEINHEIIQVILRLKNVNIKKIGARYLSFQLTQVYKNFTVSSLELKQLETIKTFLVDKLKLL